MPSLSLASEGEKETRMKTINRRPNLKTQTTQHFVDYINGAVRENGFADSPRKIFPKKLVMDYSFVHQNIIPGWVYAGQVGKGLFSLDDINYVAEMVTRREPLMVPAMPKAQKGPSKAEARKAGTELDRFFTQQRRSAKAIGAAQEAAARQARRAAARIKNAQEMGKHVARKRAKNALEAAKARAEKKANA
jgi:hypothetical protein